MLVTVIIHPDVFSISNFHSIVQRHNAEVLLTDMIANGLLIVDGEGSLRKKLITTIERLAQQNPKMGQRIAIFFEEFLKISGRVVKCNEVSVSSTQDVTQVTIQALPGIDGLIIPKGGDGDEVIESLMIEEYIDSLLRTLFQTYQTTSKPIDQIPREYVADMLVRATRFSRTLRIIDKQLGKGNTPRRFYEGIAFILQLWEENCYFRCCKRSVEVISAFPYYNGPHTLMIKKDDLERQLVEPLQKRFPNVSIKLVLKNDPDNIMHARHLQTDGMLIMIDPGFDFITQNGFRRAFFIPANQSVEHINEVRSLTDTG